MINRNIVFPSVVILFSAFALWLISQFDSPLYQDASVDASFFPTMIVIFQIIICTVLLIQHKVKGTEKFEAPILTKMSLFGIGYLISYAFIIHYLGYLYASLIAFMAYLVFFKIKKPSYYIMGIGFVFTVYYLFGKVFYIALPEASWM